MCMITKQTETIKVDVPELFYQIKMMERNGRVRGFSVNSSYAVVEFNKPIRARYNFSFNSFGKIFDKNIHGGVFHGFATLEIAMNALSQLMENACELSVFRLPYLYKREFTPIIVECYGFGHKIIGEIADMPTIDGFPCVGYSDVIYNSIIHKIEL